MRIIAGEYGGRPLKSVPGNNTRPTTDKVKEAMFHMAGPYFDGGTVLDLFAGSGALGIEAVSRGMDKAYLVDQDKEAIKVIKDNIKVTKDEKRFDVIQKKVSVAFDLLVSKEARFDLVILDPPYKKEEILENIEKLNTLKLFKEEAIIICETDDDVDLPEKIAQFQLVKDKNYGKTNVFIYESGGNYE